MPAGPGTTAVGRIGDDLVLPFHADRSPIMGRLVRLGPVVDEILNRHAYPEPVSVLLGEALALTAMVGTTLKSDHKLIVQTQTDGPVNLLVVHYETPGQMRGYARFDAGRLEALTARQSKPSAGTLLGRGHLALTIDPGHGMEQYQGIVALDGDTLTDAAHAYFQQSVQLPTFIKLAVARHYAPGQNGGTNGDGTAAGFWRWRAGGLMVQHLTGEGGQRTRDARPGVVVEPVFNDDGFERARILAATAEHHEMLDPLLAPERLLYRLFHEESVRVFDARPISVTCRCSRERVARLLQLFPEPDIADMTETDGSISFTCEFCNTTQRFEVDDVAAARAANA